MASKSEEQDQELPVFLIELYIPLREIGLLRFTCEQEARRSKWQPGRMHGFDPLTYLSVLGDGAGVNLEDVQTSLLIGQFNVCNRVEGILPRLMPRVEEKCRRFLLAGDTDGRLTDFTVEPARPQQGRVQGVGSVGGHDHLDSVEGVEAVHLVQQLTRRQKEDTFRQSLQFESSPGVVSRSSTALQQTM